MGLYDSFLKEQGNTTVAGGGIYGQFLSDMQPKQSFLSKVGGAISNYAQASANTVIPFGNAILHPIETVKTIGKTLVNDLTTSGQKIISGATGIFTDKGAANKVADTANLISGIAQAAFEPVSGAFKIAGNVPGLKQVADTINIPFSVAGFVGSWSTGKAVDWLPISQASKDTIKAPLQEVGSLAGQVLLGGKIMEKISTLVKNGTEITPEVAKSVVDEAKVETANHPAMAPQVSQFDQYKRATSVAPTLDIKASIAKQEGGSYTTVNKDSGALGKYQIMPFRLPEIGIPNSAVGIKKFLASPTLQNRLFNKIIDGLQVKYQDPAKVAAAYYGGDGGVAKYGTKAGDVPQGKYPSINQYVSQVLGRVLYEPITPTEQLPVIPFGTKAKDTLPTIQIGTPSSKVRGDVTYEPIKYEPIKTEISRPQVSPFVKQSPISEVIPMTPKIEAQPNSGTATSGLGKSIEQKAVEQGLTEGFGKVAGYDASTIAEQARLSTDLINSGIEKAREVIRGDVPLPDRLRGSSLIVAMEDYLKKNPDGQIAYELANSPLTSAVSQAGSELGLMQNRVPDSLTAKFREIKKARESVLEKKVGLKKSIKSSVDEITNEIKKTASKRPTWDEFIKEIQCNY